MNLLNTIFGDTNAKFLKKFQPVIDQINQLETEFSALTDDQIKEKTDSFKAELKNSKDLFFSTKRQTSSTIFDSTKLSASEVKYKNGHGSKSGRE